MNVAAVSGRRHPIDENLLDKGQESAQVIANRTFWPIQGRQQEQDKH